MALQPIQDSIGAIAPGNIGYRETAVLAWLLKQYWNLPKQLSNAVNPNKRVLYRFQLNMLTECLY